MYNDSSLDIRHLQPALLEHLLDLESSLHNIQRPGGVDLVQEAFTFSRFSVFHRATIADVGYPTNG
jgi:hypothetical protein